MKIKNPCFNCFLVPVVCCIVLFNASLYGQTGSINNTLGTGGSFVIKDGSTTFLTLSQSDGKVSLSNILTLPVTTGSTLGVIFKGADRFIHDFQGSGTDGYNTFVGINAGNFSLGGISPNEGSYNTAVGYFSLTSLTRGEGNSAFGYGALFYNTEGAFNSAVGFYALRSNSTGYYNSAVGYYALFYNTEGAYNSAVGNYALYSNSTGGYNSTVGFQALYSNSTGWGNSAFGNRALYLTTSSFNTAVGDSAGSNLTSGSNNTLIGYNAQPSVATASNEVVLGNSSIEYLRCQVNTISSLSDARDKKGIRDLPLGLDFLMSVKPRQFNWDRREWYEDGKADGSKMQENPAAGFIAQELDEAQKSADAEWLNLVLKSNPERFEATPGNLLPIMVKAIQELKNENDALRHRVSQLEAEGPKQQKLATTAIEPN